MVRYAIIENGVVTNIAAAEPEFAASQGWIDATGAQIGDTWDGETFTRPAPPPPTKEDVHAERDRRLALDFEFQGVMYQRDQVSMQRIAGAAQLATIAISQGAQPGDLRWHGGDSDFGWIASDDTVTPMDAQTVVAFGMAAAAVETSLIFAARALRNMDPIPTDFAEDHYWP